MKGRLGNSLKNKPAEPPLELPVLLGLYEKMLLLRRFETAAQIVLSPLKANPPSNVIVDLSRVKFFTSEFISFLLRCHVIVKRHHGELVLAGVSTAVRELLRQTALDTLWAIYTSRQQALDALGGTD